MPIRQVDKQRIYIGGNMGILIGIIGFVIMALFVNYLVTNAEREAKKKAHEGDNTNIIELDKAELPRGEIFCKNCQHLKVTLDATYICNHPDCFKQTGFDVINGRSIIERVESKYIHRQWNKHCNCVRFKAIGEK